MICSISVFGMQSKLTDHFLGSVASASVLSMLLLPFVFARSSFDFAFLLVLHFAYPMHLHPKVALLIIFNQSLCLKRLHSVQVGDRFLIVIHWYISNAFNVLLLFSFYFLSSVLSSQGGYIFKPQLVLQVKNSKSVLGIILSGRLLRNKLTVLAHLQML